MTFDSVKAPPAPQTNPVAILALILGFIIPVGGIIAGHIALHQIKRSHEAGQGLALAGTIVGYSLTALAVLGICAYILFFVGLFVLGASDPSLGTTPPLGSTTALPPFPA